MNVIVVGASGYSGIELIRILLRHPRITISHLYVNNQEHESLIEIFPHLRNLIDLKIESLATLTEEKIKELKQVTNIIFFATPSGVSTVWGKKFLDLGFKVIDLSGDYRLKNPAIYKEWYKLEPPTTDLLDAAVYGLPEWFAEEIKKANYIANPGCYATSILLGLAPIFNAGLPVKSVIIDAKSGVSGAGRKLGLATHFSEINENFKAYKVGVHQHIPEVEQILTQLGEKDVTIQMITHLLPITRGILSTIYIDFDNIFSIAEENLLRMYHEAYKNKPFVRVKPIGELPETKQVYGTNYCDISFYLDKRTNRLVLFSVIDNLMKGAAGQAVQNLNLIIGYEQTMGLDFVPIYP